MNTNPPTPWSHRTAGPSPMHDGQLDPAIQVALDETRRAGCWDTSCTWQGAPFGGSLQLVLSSGAKVSLSIPPLTRQVIVVGGPTGPHEFVLAMAGFVRDGEAWIYFGVH